MKILCRARIDAGKSDVIEIPDSELEGMSDERINDYLDMVAAEWAAEQVDSSWEVVE